MDAELTAFKWEDLHPESSRPGVDSDRFLKKGVWSSMQRSLNWGLVIQGGATVSYQCPGTSSNKTSFVDIQEVRINQINSLPNRQQSSNFLSIENGDTTNQTMIALLKEIWKLLLKKNIRAILKKV